MSLEVISWKMRRRQLFESFQICNLLDAEQVKILLEQGLSRHHHKSCRGQQWGLSWKIPQKTVDVNVTGGLEYP